MESGWPGTGTLVVLKREGDSLTTSLLGKDSLRAALARGDIQLSWLGEDSEINLTDRTARFVPALTEYLRRPGVLTGTRVWRRLRP